MKTSELTKSALMSAVLCIISPFTVPLGAVPLSLSTFGVYLAAVVLKPAYAVLSVVVYIALGAFGLPVFAGANGGIGVITGPTGGFLIGYVLCVLSVSFFKDKIKTVPAMVLGTLLIYAAGTAWFVFVTKSIFLQAFLACILPFLPGDVMKIAAASVVGIKIINAIKHSQ